METYVLDTDALINLHSHFHSRFRQLRHMVQQGQIKIPEGVFRELQRKTDRLFKTIRQWSESNSECVVEAERVYGLREQLVHIEQRYGNEIVVGAKSYPGFWHSPSGQKAADGQVVAAAKVLNATVVSDDRAVRLACMLEGIPCISWSEFARRSDLATQPALPGIDE